MLLLIPPLFVVVACHASSMSSELHESQPLSKKLRVSHDVKIEIERIKKDPFSFPPPPKPTPPLFNPTVSRRRQIRAIQRYINAFHYNFTGQTFVSLRRDKGMKHLVLNAKLIMRACLPIQCVEALFVAVHLTKHMKGLVRIPMSFHSYSNGKHFHHMVLGIRDNMHWGAIGISRLSNLMYKNLSFTSLSELVEEFLKSYKHYYHDVKEIALGLPFTHDGVSETPLIWKLIKIKVDETNSTNTWKDYTRALNQYSKDSSIIFEHYEQRGDFPPWCTDCYRNGFVTIRCRR